MNILPAMKIAQGESFAYSVTVVGRDWTGYTGTATFKGGQSHYAANIAALKGR